MKFNDFADDALSKWHSMYVKNVYSATSIKTLDRSSSWPGVWINRYLTLIWLGMLDCRKKNTESLGFNSARLDWNETSQTKRWKERKHCLFILLTQFLFTFKKSDLIFSLLLLHTNLSISFCTHLVAYRPRSSSVCLFVCLCLSFSAPLSLSVSLSLYMYLYISLFTFISV